MGSEMCIRDRYTFVIMPVAALLVATEWESLIVRKKISIFGLALGLAASVGVLLQTGQRASGEVIKYDGQLIVLCLIFAGLLGIGYFCRTKKIWGIVEVFLGICLIISVGRENYINNNERRIKWFFTGCHDILTDYFWHISGGSCGTGSSIHFEKSEFCNGWI